MSSDGTPSFKRHDGCCSPKTPDAACIVITTHHDDDTRLLSYDTRLCCCPACGDGFTVDDKTYALALLADAAWLRREHIPSAPPDERAELEARAAEWERLAGILLPDPRQAGFGFGERS